MLCHGIEELGGGGKSSISPASTTNMWPQDMGKRLLIPSNTTSITNNKEKNSMTQVVSSSPLPNKLERAVLECPRCNSSNTKFCYYNNYSLSQPRHFCKACKRYWTRGGTLRNVPVGGGCRKNKRARKPTPAPAPALTPPPPPPPPPTSSSVHALSLPPLDSSLNHLFFSSSSEMGLSYPLPSSSPSCANFDLQPSHLSSLGLGLGYHHLISPLPSSDVFATNVDHHSLLQFEENANLGMVKFESGDILATNSTPLDPSFLYWNAPLF